MLLLSPHRVRLEYAGMPRKSSSDQVNDEGHSLWKQKQNTYMKYFGLAMNILEILIF